MVRITLRKDGTGPAQVHSFEKREITVGRTKANDLVIPEPGVSSTHARLLDMGSGELTLIDLESTNGTFVNGKRIQGPHIVSARDEVYICAWKLEFDFGSGAPANAYGPPPAGGANPPTGFIEPPPFVPASIGGPSAGGPGPIGGPPPPIASAPSPVSPLSVAPPPPLSPSPPSVAPPPPLPTPVGAYASSPAPPPTIAPPAMLDLPPLVNAPPTGTPPPAVTPSPAAAASPPASASPPMVSGSIGDPSPPPSMTPAPAMAPVPPPPPMEPPPEVAPPAWGQPPEMPPVVVASPPIADAAAVRTGGTVTPSFDTPSPEPIARLQSVPTPAPRSMTPPPISMTPPPVTLDEPEPEPAAPSGPGEVAVISGRTQWAGAVEEVGPPRAQSPHEGPRRAGGVAPAPVPAAIEVAPSVPSDDLSDLQGPGAEPEACARVFVLVHHALAPGGELPERDAESRARARTEAQRLLTDVATRVPGLQARPLANRIANELCGLGPLSAPLAEPDVREIFVHGPTRILVRRASGPAERLDAAFSCPQAVEMVVRRLTHTWFGVDNPIADARTFDGADVHAVHDSIATGGPVVTITLPGQAESQPTLDALVAAGDLSQPVAHVLRMCVEAGLNILVCGAPGARTFPLMAALAASVPASQRIALVRAGHEPGLVPENVVVLQGDGLVGTEGATVMQALVRAALGLGSDRLFAHEVAGPEAADVLAAMGRGMGGAVVSTRAGSADHGLRRVAALCGLGGTGSDHATRAQYVAASVEVIVTVSRFPGGRNRVTQLAESMVDGSGRAGAVDLVTFDPNSRRYTSTGIVPGFFAELQRRGIAVDPNILD